MLFEQAHESDTPQPPGRDGLVHVARPGVPPGTSAVVGRDLCAGLFESKLAEFLDPGAWLFPLAPQDAAQFPTQPFIQFLEAPFDLSQPEVRRPAPPFG